MKEEYIENGNLPALPAKTRELSARRPPEVILEEATKVARALQNVIAQKRKKIMFNGEQYLEFEDLELLGRFYDVTAKVVDTNHVKYGDVEGFTARAAAINADGIEVSAAEADCLNDEPKWRSRPRYKTVYVLKDGSETEEEPPKNKIAWEKTADGKWFPKRKRVYAGEEPVPLFQLKSMAQTRACAKALRNVLSWVVVLAGYRPTPAEELDGMAAIIDVLQPAEAVLQPVEADILPTEASSHTEEPELQEPRTIVPPTEAVVPPAEAAPNEAKPPVASGNDGVKGASERQVKAINTMMRKLGIDDDFARHSMAEDILGLASPPDSLNDLTGKQASALIDALNELLEAQSRKANK